MKKIIAFALAVSMVLVLFAGCSSKKDWEYLEDKGTLVIGYTLINPLNYMDGENLVGFETEFAKAVCEELGLTAKFQKIDWNSKESELKSKTIDCVWNGMTITEERLENMGISTPYMKNRQVMVVKAENAELYSDSANIGNAKIVAEKGSAGEELAQEDAQFKDATYTAVDSQAKAVMEVAAGTADIAIIDYIMSLATIGEGTSYANLTTTTQEFEEEEYGIAFRKGDTETLKKVNDAIKTIAENGKLKAIAEKYGLLDALLIEVK